MSKKTELIKEILTSLNPEKKYTKTEIEASITKITLAIDKRTLNNWFRLLWIKNYLIQLEPSIYIVNLKEIVKLEVKVNE